MYSERFTVLLHNKLLGFQIANSNKRILTESIQLGDLFLLLFCNLEIQSVFSYIEHFFFDVQYVIMSKQN